MPSNHACAAPVDNGQDLTKIDSQRRRPVSEATLLEFPTEEEKQADLIDALVKIHDPIAFERGCKEVAKKLQVKHAAVMNGMPPFPPLPLFAFPRLERCISRFTSVPRVPPRLRNRHRPHRVGAHSEPVMKARYLHHQPRWGGIGPIDHAIDDDDQIETWMIGQGQEPSGKRHIVVRRAWDRC